MSTDSFLRAAIIVSEVFVVFAVFLAAFSVVDLPVTIWNDFVHDKKWGFSTMTPGRFVGDLVKGIVLGTILQAPLLLALYWLM